MSKENFYEELDLKYIEIGYNMTVIDRINPGTVPFNIPVLTPQMDNSTMKDTKIIQRDKTNIQNASSGSVDVSDLQMSNYIYITVPKELCALPSSEYHVKGRLNINGSMSMTNGRISYDATLNQHYIHGIVSDYSGIVNGSGTEKGSMTYSGSQRFSADTTVEGTLLMVPTDQYRYIPKGKRWAISFIGGDINMPMVLSMLPD